MSLETVVKIEPPEVEIKTEFEVKIEPGVAAVETSNVEGSEVFIKQEPIWVATEPECENDMEPNNETKKEVSSPDRTHDLDMLDKPLIISKKYSVTKFIRKKQIFEMSTSMYTCDICQKRFPEMRLLINHKISDSDNCNSGICSSIKIYVCRFCRREFKQPLTLKEHEKVHFRGDSYYCDICDEEFDQKQVLVKHSSIHETKKHKCNVCKKEFNLKSQLHAHNYPPTSVGAKRWTHRRRRCIIAYKIKIHSD